MEIAKVHVSGILAGTVYCKPIPAGIVGATVRFEYADPVWDGLTKTVVFKGGCTKDVLNAGEVVEIPPEVVAIKGTRLVVGIYGTDAQNNLVIPTLWADLGVVLPATAPSGDTSTDPSLPVWAQLEAMIGDLTQLDTEAKSSLVAAINESMKYSGDSIDEATLREMVDDYLAANPPAAGTPGQDGGYYTPSVTQPDEGTVEFNFTPSREGMPEVPGQSVTLPAGPGGSGIHVGTEEPEDEDIDIWVNPDGEPVNLMEAPKQAKVGQTIVVSAVDENGAPIAWEAADLPAVEAEAPSGTSEWKYAGKFTTTEHVNPFTITEDENGNPLSFKELFLRVNLRWFHHSDNLSANRCIALLGGDGNWYSLSLNQANALKITKADTPDEITVLPTDVTPLRIDKIGDYVYSSALNDQYNNALSECCAAVGCKGIHCPGVTTFTGLRFSMGYATNLIVAGSNVEVYYK